MKKFNFIAVIIIGVLLLSITVKPTAENPVINKQKMLERHNYYRDMLKIPHLEWSGQLAEYAQNWANKLAKSCNMTHSGGGYGENIFWTSGKADEYEVVDLWASEKRYYNHKNRVYKRNSSRKTGHYSQLIWKNTTHVGGAMQKCRHGGEIWVCSYSPAGNFIGQKAY